MISDGDERTSLVTGLLSELGQTVALTRRRWAHVSEGMCPGLSGLGLITLQIILRSGPISAKEISTRMGIDKAAVSRQVAFLRKQELITESESPHDRRVMLLTRTEQAEALIEEFRAIQAANYIDRLTDWTPEELTALRTLLHKFNEANEYECSRGPASDASDKQ
ncbi:MarR family transcriptional regulator [Leucobacter sp. cx-328]|uniref:MarR family winged helix-turn-helix transcriptional regulator n=1 Tax=unclassified Leucobacter TaxID=2621730 RepID=UPI00165D5ED3|nr:MULTISPECIES: MarR family transcriptional regulator [unclassified Leucobacter]MBC9944607.1 MarR family transcriptional regulator [Leucobacter sp. cx-328]